MSHSANLSARVFERRSYSCSAISTTCALAAGAADVSTLGEVTDVAMQQPPRLEVQAKASYPQPRIVTHDVGEPSAKRKRSGLSLLMGREAEANDLKYLNVILVC